MRILLIVIALVTGVHVENVNGQKPRIAATTKCRSAKSSIPAIGGLYLGASYQNLKMLYPSMVEMDRPSPAATTNAFIVRKPLENVSLIALLFTSDNKLGTYTLYYEPQEWSTLEEPTQKMIDNLGLSIPRSMWDFFTEDGKDAIIVECKDFGLYTTFRQSISSARFFNFTVMDRALVNKFGKSGTLSTATNNRAIPSITSTNVSEYVFPPTGSEFSVKFPSKPTIKTVSSDYGTVEEATVSTNNGTLRAEYGLMSNEQRVASKTLDSELLRQSGLNTARMFGYTGTTVTVYDSPYGKCLKIRGYKTLNGISVLIEHYGYFGDRSIMTLITATKADEYPTRSISNFLSSIQRR